MRSWIDHSGQVVWDPSLSLVTQLVETAQPFWLDIENPTDELATRLGLHPLAVEDSKQFGQVYGNGAMLVGFGLDGQLREPVEVHCYYTTEGWPAFLILGVGLSVAFVAVTVFVLNRRGWN